MKSIQIPFFLKAISPEQSFMLTILAVNGGNYLYNLVLGRILGPEAFSDAAILITLLLALSFVGMTFQIVTAKYTVLFNSEKHSIFLKWVIKYALLFGLVTCGILIVFCKELQIFFHTKTANMFVVFAIGLPIYFLMSINRGVFQGNQDLKNLSKTYLLEMLSRLGLTFFLLIYFPIVSTSEIIAIGLTFSFMIGLFLTQNCIVNTFKGNEKTILPTKPIVVFFALTAFYELTQILINNSDIMLVKHSFDNKQAGLYASLALIGRVVYFVSWMFVMILLPKVIQMEKEGENSVPVLLKNVSYIVALSTFIVISTYIFPEFIIKVLFGADYTSIAPLLWKYALATSLFAVANIFAYYFLSIGNYIPVVLSALLGLTQIALIVLYHETLEQVVEMQILAMVILMICQLTFFFYQNKKSIHLN